MNCILSFVSFIKTLCKDYRGWIIGKRLDYGKASKWKLSKEDDNMDYKELKWKENLDFRNQGEMEKERRWIM